MRFLLTPVAAIFLASGAGSGALESPNDLAKWVVTKPPVEGDARWKAAAFDPEHTWVVSLQNGLPSARLKSRDEPVPAPLPFTIHARIDEEGLDGRRLSVKVDDGWILAFNEGEWGGWLWWFSPDGKRHYKIASRCWVNGFVETDAGLLMVGGLSHLGDDERGGITRLSRKKEDGRWHREGFVTLGEEAELAVKDGDGTLIVATPRRLLRIHPTTRKVDVLVGDGFWNCLYPTSMVLTTQGAVYLGMRHGVAKVERRGGAYRVEWLLPTEDFDRMTKLPEGVR